MQAASSLLPNGAGLSFFRFSMARSTMPSLGPSLAGRANSTAGTLALTQWAAICAPITPAPRTATFLTMKLLTVVLSLKQFGFEIEQIRGARARLADQHGGFRQQPGVVKAGGGELGLVETVAGIELRQRDLRHAGEEVGVHQMTDHAQVGNGGGADFILVPERLHADFHGQLGKLAAELAPVSYTHLRAHE